MDGASPRPGRAPGFALLRRLLQPSPPARGRIDDVLVAMGDLAATRPQIIVAALSAVRAAAGTGVGSAHGECQDNQD